MATDIGTVYVRVAPNMTGIQGKIAAGFKGSGSQFANQFSSEFSAKAAVITGAVAGVAAAAVSKAMSLVSNSIDGAVSRVDALKRFPTVMENLGYSANDASKQIGRIASSLIGLPTSLDSLTTFVQRVAPVSGSLEHATDVALAFNNAVLAGGGPTYRQADAIEQFSQMLSKGVPDMMAWRTLQESMPATLGQIARKLGITSGNTLELFDALQSGKLGFKDFTDAVVSLNSEGLPGFKSFAAQAKDSTSGIATGMQNAQTAITRGVASIIDSIGAGNIASAISNIGKAFETSLGVIATIIPPTILMFTDFFNFISTNKDILGPLAVGILSIVGAIKLWTTAVTIGAAVQGIFNAVLAANPITLVALALVGLVAGLVYFFTQTETGKKIFQTFGQVVGGVWASVSSGFAALAASLGRIFNSIRDTFNGIYSIGKNIVQGLWNGINDMSSWIVGKIKGFGDNVLKGIKSFFGIHSPSTVFAGIGVNLNRGLAQGLESSTGLVTGAVDSMANKALMSMTTPLADADVSLGGSVGNGYTPQASNAGVTADFNGANFYLGGPAAVSQWFKELNQDTLNISQGLTPQQGAQ